MAVRLYAVARVKAGTKTLPSGMKRERLELLNLGFGSAVFANARIPLAATSQNLLEYHRVIAALADISTAILPARFGMTANSAAQFRTELHNRRAVLQRALDVVEGRVQMTLRDLRAVAGRSDAPEHTPAGKPSIRSSQVVSGTEYLASRAAMAPSVSPAVDAARKAVAEIVTAEHVEPEHANGIVVYHLIRHDDVPRYRLSVDAAAIDGTGCCRVAGPFPPYAFVPGIDHALTVQHERPEIEARRSGSERPRARRRSTRDANR